jgi:hypothetical protein
LPLKITKKLDTKIQKLLTDQTKTPASKETFAPRIVNKTDIEFTHDEYAPLNKGLKYNVHLKKKNWIKT